jgi:hypothetical protein
VCIDQDLNQLYSGAEGIVSVYLQVAFQGFAERVSLEALQQRVNAKLETRLANYAGERAAVIRATELTEPIEPPSVPPDPSVSELRLYLWL